MYVYAYTEKEFILQSRQTYSNLLYNLRNIRLLKPIPFTEKIS